MSSTTTDLNEIKEWAEARNGKPSKVKDVGKGKGGGIIRIDFPGYSGGDTLEEISWDEWYKIFKDEKLEFLYQDETANGKQSRFFKLVNKK
jgi:hypothetical protein